MRNRAASIHQLELKWKHKLSDQMFHDMLRMLAVLTPAERATLSDPEFITGDEADLILSARSSSSETGKSIRPRKSSAKVRKKPR